MNRIKSKFFKRVGAVALMLAMFITMIPITEVWADTPIDNIAPTNVESNESIYVSYSYLLGKETYWDNIWIDIEKEITYGELESILADKLECPANEEYSFTGWACRDYDENEYVTGRFVNIYAEYDKYPMSIDMAFLDDKGDLKVIDEVVDFPHGTTYGDVLNVYAPEVTEWLVSGNYYSLEDEIFISRNYISANGQYENKHIVYYSYSWIKDSNETTEYGVEDVEFGYILVDKEIAESEENLATEIIETVEVDYFDKIENVDLRINAIDEFNTIDKRRDGYIDIISLNSIYEHDMVKLYAYDKDNSCIFERYYVVEQNETFYLPMEYESEKIYWLYNDTNEYYTGSFIIPTVETDSWKTYSFAMTTMVEDDAVIHENPALPSEPTMPNEPTEPSDPSAPNEPTEPSEPSAPNEPSTPTEDKTIVKLEEEKITETTNKIEEAIKEAEKNETSEEAKPVQVVVDMKREDGTVATEVPKEILEVAKGQNVEVVLDMGDYTWTINGNDINGTDLKAINLEVKLDVTNIPQDKISTVAGKNKVQQLALTHSGDFGFKAVLTINVGKENNGQYGNLYYYNKDGKLEFIDSGKIDKDGKVSLEFTHASDYVVVIANEAVVPETGDNTSIALYVCVLLAGVGLMVVSLRKSKVA